MLDDYRQVIADAEVHVALQGTHVVGVLVLECERRTRQPMTCA